MQLAVNAKYGLMAPPLNDILVGLIIDDFENDQALHNLLVYYSHKIMTQAMDLMNDVCLQSWWEIMTIGYQYLFWDMA